MEHKTHHPAWGFAVPSVLVPIFFLLFFGLTRLEAEVMPGIAASVPCCGSTSPILMFPAREAKLSSVTEKVSAGCLGA